VRCATLLPQLPQLFLLRTAFVADEWHQRGINSNSNSNSNSISDSKSNQIKSNQISSFDLSEAKLFGVVPDALDIVLKLFLKLGLKMQYFVVEGMYVPVCMDGWI